MKIRAIVTAAALFAGMVGPSFASCDVHGEDKQALCAQKCDDSFIRDKMHYNSDLAKVSAEKKACDEKCGCPQNSADIK
ncbi:MAG: hypothetical protein C3F11_19385 [Methylocystaceae bacterium]|nr:MAG: hypothetical protein C3F11_19385 [Methylocystaceae bacterium]